MTHPFHTRIPRTHSTYSCHTLIQHIRSTHSFPINSTRAFPSQDTLIPNSWHIHYSVLLQSLVAESLSFPSHDTFIPNSWHIPSPFVTRSFRKFIPHSSYLHVTRPFHIFTTRSFPIHGTFLPHSRRIQNRFLIFKMVC